MPNSRRNQSLLRFFKTPPFSSINLRSAARSADSKVGAILNGADLSKFRVGEVILVDEAVAAMLIREGWAELVDGDKIADKVHCEGSYCSTADWQRLRFVAAILSRGPSI
jgi:hypothetical protein